ncbi:hypothetical protein K8M07_03195 [Schnuerera sp. xch1]|uniref:hypothetical protein n=1 Tax=Schnuerera sp. xch1 TaxID=2874283 RepID=UPI001CC00E9B|nr:hypothetical protein [Schnuerera sp. xch1]MBZ2174247.1 hypothetical protein [Schnuerera sp. xch1]
MIDSNKENKKWIEIKLNKKNKDLPSELRIDMNGDVYVDGELYDETKSKYKNLNIDVEQHNKLSSGEETQRIIEESKKAKKGEFVTIKEEESPEKKEITTVKF